MAHEPGGRDAHPTARLPYCCQSQKMRGSKQELGQGEHRYHQRNPDPNSTEALREWMSVQRSGQPRAAAYWSKPKTPQGRPHVPPQASRRRCVSTMRPVSKRERREHYCRGPKGKLAGLCSRTLLSSKKCPSLRAAASMRSHWKRRLQPRRPCETDIFHLDLCGTKLGQARCAAGMHYSWMNMKAMAESC
jgi:hypothetical protein